MQEKYNSVTVLLLSVMVLLCGIGVCPHILIPKIVICFKATTFPK